MTLPNKSKYLIIIGSGGHARSAIEIARNRRFKIKGIIDTQYKKKDINEKSLIIIF